MTATKENEMSKKELYVYSLNGERFMEKSEEGDVNARAWETREEALLAGREHAELIGRLKEVDPNPVWTGVKVTYSASAFFPDADAILEAMSDHAKGEMSSEYVDDWPDVHDETAGQELRDFVKETIHPFLEAWVEKHELEPTFWSVTDVAKHAEDDSPETVETTP